MKNISCKWKFEEPLDQDGVIVGCDCCQEWLLPWWHMNYSQHNTFPITFIDFGNMSSEAKAWCEKKGQLLSLAIPSHQFVTEKSKIDPELIRAWDKAVTGTDVWKARLEFFKKPFACLSSPYRRTIWMDVDCQVFKPLQHVFEASENAWGITITEEPLFTRETHIQNKLIEPDEIEYNSGVIGFKHGISLIEDWATFCLDKGTNLRGDQEALSFMLYKRKIKLPPLSAFYNWRGDRHLEGQKNHSSIAVIHWLGPFKNIIKFQIAELENKGLKLSFDSENSEQN